MNQMENKKNLLIKKRLVLYAGLCINAFIKLNFLNQFNVNTESRNIEIIDGSLPHYEYHCLTYEPKQEYYDIPIYDEAFQEHIFEISDKYGFAHDILFTIGHVESDGTWATNGVISPTNDYGLFQINITNHKQIYQVLGFTSDDLQYDPYKNAEAAAYLIKTFFDLYDYDITNFNYKNIFGTYNGYINWEEKEQSLEYVDYSMKILEEKYSKIERLERTKK
ncbi:MAG: transglycosylase SLT domain-containing protein [Bacilli bacterium]|nr:transglycosylase SLT domain-containing protein [Bacilli bacterium]